MKNVAKSIFALPHTGDTFGDKVRRQLREDARRPLFWLCIAAVLVLGYAYFLTNPSVSADDTAFGRYYGQADILLQGHFTSFLVQQVFPVLEYQSLYLDFVALLLMTGAAAVLGAALTQAAGEGVSHRLAPLFPCVFLSYSLICEIFIFMQNTLDIGIGYLLAALALVLGYEFVFQKAGWDGRCTLAALCLCFAVASYESFAVVYLTGVLCLMFLRAMNPKEHFKALDCLVQCLRSGLVLLAGLVAKMLVGRLMLLLYAGRLAGHTNASLNSVQWLAEGLGGVPRKFLGLLAYLVLDFILPVLCSLPIRELMVCILLALVLGCVLARTRRRPALILVAFLLCAVQFALGVIQGPTEDWTVQPYRICQSFAVFVGFVVWLCVQLLAARPKRFWGVAGTVAAVWLVGLQCYDLNSWFYADEQRYAYEANIIDQVALELEKNYPIAEKPVVFAGEIELPRSIDGLKYTSDEGPELALANKILVLGGKEPLEHYAYMQTLLNSVINWSITAWYDQAPNEQTYNLFAMQGHLYLPCTEEQYLQGRKAAENLPDWPLEGSISDEGEYILVRF